MVAAFNQFGGQAAALHSQHIGGLTGMAKARQHRCVFVEFNTNQRAAPGQAHRPNRLKSVKWDLLIGSRGVRLENVGIEGSRHGKRKMRAKTMGGAKQVPRIHGLGDTLYANSEISSHIDPYFPDKPLVVQ